MSSQDALGTWESRCPNPPLQRSVKQPAEILGNRMKETDAILW